MKRQDPNAKVEPLEKVKGEIKTALARQKWLDDLKVKANITVNESVLGASAPSMPAMQAQPSGASGQQTK